MPRARSVDTPGLEQRIGRALLEGRGGEGVLAIEAGRVAACSPGTAELLGVRPGDLHEAPLQDLLARLDGDLLKLRLQSALLDDGPVEFVAPRPGREDEWIEVRSLPLSPGLAFLLRDVTDREVAERSIRRKEQRLLAANRSLRLAHAAARAASWEWRRGRSLRWLDLPAARELASLPASWTEEEEVRDWRRILPAELKPAFTRAVRVLTRRGLASWEVEVTGSDGERHWMRIEGAVTERDLHGAPSRVSGVTMDVTEPRRAAQALQAEVAQRKRSEERQQLLLHELNHRVKNMLSTVQSVARQSLRTADLRGAAQEFEERLMALAWTYEILTREHWEGASIQEVLERTLAPHMEAKGARLALDGPHLWLAPNRALSLALAFHELATNAVKYGALSNAEGRISVLWRVDEQDGWRKLALAWRETDGPPVNPPGRRGFGSRLIERSLAHELDGEATLSFAPEGLQCRIVVPLGDAPAAAGDRGGRQDRP